MIGGGHRGTPLALPGRGGPGAPAVGDRAALPEVPGAGPDGAARAASADGESGREQGRDRGGEPGPPPPAPALVLSFRLISPSSSATCGCDERVVRAEPSMGLRRDLDAATATRGE
ncbi:hypothetical protein GCM10010275_23600 [Streptomyces litmocidini]|nr:hypothetical protein GCM10010275_23600 [Streptomyces litmocidini]